MIVPKLGNLTVGSLEQILIVEIDKGVVPVGGIGTADKQGCCTHSHYIAGLAHIEETACKEACTPVDTVEVPLGDKEFDVGVRTVGYHLGIVVVLLTQAHRTAGIATLLLVMMQTEVIEILTATLDELLVLAETTTGDNLDAGIDLTHGGAEIAYTLLVALDTHLPHLIINLPVLHVVRLGMTVGSTLGTPLIGSGGIAVTQPVNGILQYLIVLAGGALELNAYHDNRLGVNLATETDKLVGTKAVLIVIHPHPVVPTLTVLLRTDTPLPVVLGHITATRPAQTGGMKLLNGLQDVGTESTQIDTTLGGHGGHINLYATIVNHDGEIAVAAGFGL